MTDHTSSGSEQPQGKPDRVIWTPSPAEKHRLLAPDEGGTRVEPHVGDYELDEKAARRAERVVAAFFVLAFLASVGFIVYYIGFSGRHGGMHGIYRARESNFFLGGFMALAFLALAAGVTIWVRRLMTAPPLVQDRHELYSSPETKAAFAAEFKEGLEGTGLAKRPLLRRTLLLAAAPLGLAPILLLRDLGPLPEKKLRTTYWGDAVRAAQSQGAKGVRLAVADTGRELSVADFNSPGAMITVVPAEVKDASGKVIAGSIAPGPGQEAVPNAMDQLAKAATILINVPEELFKPLKGRENWHVGGVVAYSKICTHVGCPAALYEQTTHHILCPCHQSTFDATDGAKVIFGPAARSLPQLPISVDEEGYFIATSDYHEPVGPSFWERG
jgi:ubiquinol-cytochrome c reductase iron-sulfur subunit